MTSEPQVKDFILASGSPQRRALLAQMGFLPKRISPADIDESEKKYETATAYVKRMALEKARRIAGLFRMKIFWPAIRWLSSVLLFCIRRKTKRNRQPSWSGFPEKRTGLSVPSASLPVTDEPRSERFPPVS